MNRCIEAVANQLQLLNQLQLDSIILAWEPRNIINVANNSVKYFGCYVGFLGKTTEFLIRLGKVYFLFASYELEGHFWQICQEQNAIQKKVLC